MRAIIPLFQGSSDSTILWLIWPLQNEKKHKSLDLPVSDLGEVLPPILPHPLAPPATGHLLLNQKGLKNETKRGSFQVHLTSLSARLPGWGASPIPQIAMSPQKTRNTRIQVFDSMNLKPKVLRPTWKKSSP